MRRGRGGSGRRRGKEGEGRRKRERKQGKGKGKGKGKKKELLLLVGQQPASLGPVCKWGGVILHVGCGILCVWGAPGTRRGDILLPKAIACSGPALCVEQPFPCTTGQPQCPAVQAGLTPALMSFPKNIHPPWFPLLSSLREDAVSARAGAGSLTAHSYNVLFAAEA